VGRVAGVVVEVAVVVAAGRVRGMGRVQVAETFYGCDWLLKW
jgi:hypothetical protein